MERNPPIYFYENGQFKGLRYRIFLLIFQHRPIVNLIFINWARILLEKKNRRLWGSTMGKLTIFFSELQYRFRNVCPFPLSPHFKKGKTVQTLHKIKKLPPWTLDPTETQIQPSAS